MKKTQAKKEAVNIVALRLKVTPRTARRPRNRWLL